MNRTIEIKEAKTRYVLPLDESLLAEGPLVVEDQGKPIAAIIPFVEYERYKRWQKQQEQAAIRHAQLEKFEQERAAFLRLKSQLLQTHRGQFVAIHEGQVVAADQDKQALIRHIVERYGNEPVYIQVVAEDVPVFEIPSPEIEFDASL